MPKFEESKIDIRQIFNTFRDEGLSKFSTQELQLLLSREEVKTFATQIEMQRKNVEDRHDALVGEVELTEYIKYLVGESNNIGFEFKREDFSQRHELNKQSLKMAFDEYAR